MKKTGEPSQKEVRAYCDELGSNVDPMKFYDYYAERNWKIAGEPINDWKAVFRSWHKREFRRKPKSYLLCRYEDPVTAGDAEAPTHDDQEHLDKILAKLKKLGQQNAK